MATAEIRIGLIGCGTVGSAFAALLTERRADLEQELSVSLVLSQVAVKHPERSRPSAGDAAVHGDAARLAADPDIHLVVEASGAPEAADWLVTALERGAFVVTAHKQALATDPRLLKALAARHPRLLCEPAVAAAVPIVRALRDSLRSDEVRELRAVLNGTTTFVLSRVEQGRTLAAAVAEAQAAGYAEQDPTDDLSGKDAAAKIAILATLAWRTPVAASQGEARGLALGWVAQARAGQGQGAGRVRLVARGHRNGKLTLTVAPEHLAPEDPLNAATGVENVIEIDALGAGRLVWRGAGAGGRATASAALADAVVAAQALARA